MKFYNYDEEIDWSQLKRDYSMGRDIRRSLKGQYTDMQIDEIIRAYKLNFSLAQIEVLATSKLSAYQMSLLIDIFKVGAPLEAVRILHEGGRGKHWIGGEWRQVELGFKNGLTLKQVLAYVEFDRGEMEIIREAFEKGLTMRQVLLFARREFDQVQMLLISQALLDGLSFSRAELIANPKLCMSEINTILEMFDRGYTDEQVKHYIKTGEVK